MACSRVFSRLQRAPKYCIDLPTAIGETQQEIAASEPCSGRIRSSFSTWIARDVMDILVTNFLKPSRRLCDQSTVRLGSGEGPSVDRQCSTRKSDLEHIGRPSCPMPPRLMVTQVGSPENNSSKAFVRMK